MWRKMVDNPADMLVSNEGFDDESKLLRTVFVGNLPLKVKKKVLIKEFSKFGEVESVRIRSVPILDTKKPRKGAILTNQIHDKADSVNGYIVFRTEESAQASLSHNMAVVEGHHIRVDRACPPRKKLKGESAAVYDHTRTVFVGNLPFDVKDEEVYQLFCGINNMESNVEAIRIIRDPNYGIGKGIAYVLFRTREAANLVVKKRNLKLGDRELRLSHAKPDSTPSKRKNPSSGLKANSPAKKLAVVQGPQILTSRQDTFESRSQSGVKPKERKDKRPSVAARKAKASFKGGAAKQTGIKRKMDSRTPESSQQKKKFKKYR
ncbi:RNA-binding family protein with RRM/RBD/RNP motifs [Prunus dulcis]|uniref:RNA-binding family protein with RRM/RBD/RNP motifs n=1 Tax=Prunus dulcis TaxID=3755 RepID=A0A4Y1RF78_PRUDU|nr:RNA-binding family protein with RRM/RBD/RNP motifs [Prunus dulcis]